MQTRKLSILASFFTILELLLASCAPAAPAPTPKAAAPSAATMAPAAAAITGAQPTAKPAAPSPTPKPAADQPRYGGVLTVGVGGDPPSLDPHREETYFTYAITAPSYNGLLKYDPLGWPDVKPVPDLAASWEVSPDGKVYTFNLVKGAKFHDGAPVTAEDVKFSFDRIRDPQFGLVKSPRRQQLGAIASMDTPDDYTIRITLGYPQGSFISLISSLFFAVMPRHVVAEKKGDMTKTVVGSGAFKFKNYVSGASWEMEKNANYFVAGRPYLDGVKGYIINDLFTRFAALRTRNVLWWAPSMPTMTASQARILEETLSDKIAVEWRSQPSWYGVVFNLSKPPWSDVRVRRAVSLTFDRKRMVAAGLEGAGVVGMTTQPPGEWALPQDEMARVPGYDKPDVEGARSLMTEAGFPSGLKAEILVRSSKPHQDFAVLLKDAVAAIGINLDLKVVETGIYNDTLFRKGFDIAVGGFGTALTDPDVCLGDYYLAGAGRNWPGYNNPDYDELYVKQSRAADAGERRKIVWEMQRILLRDLPIVTAYWIKIPYVWWKEVRGYIPPVGFNNAYVYENIWLAK
ncbi:MAG: ABC transporter substrate-binding protein [Chloroflexi bacterium]|nr:ABC transporter substrate-binding protein [Chloroflexota bacterium]